MCRELKILKFIKELHDFNSKAEVQKYRNTTEMMSSLIRLWIHAMKWRKIPV
jgi:hypothetical protein